jgi:hypothetical protein
MATRFGITVDCANPATLGAFWCAVLGYQEEPAPAGFPNWTSYDLANGISVEQANAGMTIVDPAGTGPRIYFQRVPEPKVSKNRWHLDVVAAATAAAAGLAAAVSAAESLGARVLGRSTDASDVFVVLADPEGNEFCLVT